MMREGEDQSSTYDGRWTASVDEEAFACCCCFSSCCSATLRSLAAKLFSADTTSCSSSSSDPADEEEPIDWFNSSLRSSELLQVSSARLRIDLVGRASSCGDLLLRILFLMAPAASALLSELFRLKIPLKINELVQITKLLSKLQFIENYLEFYLGCLKTLLRSILWLNLVLHLRKAIIIIIFITLNLCRRSVGGRQQRNGTRWWQRWRRRTSDVSTDNFQRRRWRRWRRWRLLKGQLPAHKWRKLTKTRNGKPSARWAKQKVTAPFARLTKMECRKDRKGERRCERIWKCAKYVKREYTPSTGCGRSARTSGKTPGGGRSAAFHWTDALGDRNLLLLFLLLLRCRNPEEKNKQSENEIQTHKYLATASVTNTRTVGQQF